MITTLAMIMIKYIDMDHSIGNKYNNLRILQKHGFNVPEFKKVDLINFQDVLSTFVKENNTWDKEKLWQANPETLNSFREKLEVILKKIILQENLDDLVKDIHTEYFAVRSSFFSQEVQEDSINESFAGIGESFLFVDQNKLIEKVIQAYLSLFTSRSLEYFKNRNYDPFDFNVIVFIQKMINCKKSFIIFSKENYKNTDSILISSSYGVGEGLVQGKVAADTFVVSRDNFRLLNMEIAEKKQFYDIDKNNCSLSLQSVEAPLQLKPCLNESEIIPLSRQAMKIEKLWEDPQDLEGGIDESGKIWFFQTRPVIEIRNFSCDDEENYILDSSNVTESYPGITTPLTFHFARKAYAQIFKETAARLGISSEIIEENSDLFDNLISYHNCKIYYIVTNWYNLFKLIPGTKYYTRIWNQMIGIKKSGEKNLSGKNSLLSTIKVLLTILFRFEQHPISCQLFYHRSAELLGKYKKELNNNTSAKQTFRLLEESGSKLYNLFTVTIINDFFLMIFTKLLLVLLKFKYKTKYLEIYSKILNSLSDTYSHRYVDALNDIATDINYVFIDSKHDITFKSVIEKNELKKKIETFIQEFGTRHEGELKLEVPSLKEKPEIVFSIIKPLLEKVNKIKTSGDNSFKLKKRHPILFFLAQKTLTLVKERENMRFIRSKVYNLGRCFYLKIAQSFKESKLISNIDDIFYLTPDEIKGVIYGYFIPSQALLESTILCRKMEYEKCSHKNHYRRFHVQGLKIFPDIPTTRNTKVFKGTIAVPGTVKAPVLRLNSDTSEIPDTYILLAKELEPGNIRFLLNASGVVTEHGSIISHTAIVARQFNIPFITNVSNITTIVKDGQMLEITSEGEVRICD